MNILFITQMQSILASLEKLILLTINKVYKYKADFIFQKCQIGTFYLVSILLLQ